jgi:hypothetical protein
MFYFIFIIYLNIISSKIINEYALKCKECKYYNNVNSICNYLNQDATLCRLNRMKCGENGIYFQKNNLTKINIYKNTWGFLESSVNKLVNKPKIIDIINN